VPPIYLGSSNVPENSAANASAVAKIRKAPAKVIVLIVTATRAALVFDTALAVKLMHVV
jgi:hypothetical protein